MYLRGLGTVRSPTSAVFVIDGTDGHVTPLWNASFQQEGTTITVDGVPRVMAGATSEGRAYWLAGVSETNTDAIRFQPPAQNLPSALLTVAAAQIQALSWGGPGFKGTVCILQSVYEAIRAAMAAQAAAASAAAAASTAAASTATTSTSTGTSTGITTYVETPTTSTDAVSTVADTGVVAETDAASDTSSEAGAWWIAAGAALLLLGGGLGGGLGGSKRSKRR